MEVACIIKYQSLHGCVWINQHPLHLYVLAGSTSQVYLFCEHGLAGGLEGKWKEQENERKGIITIMKSNVAWLRNASYCNRKHLKKISYWPIEPKNCKATRTASSFLIIEITNNVWYRSMIPMSFSVLQYIYIYISFEAKFHDWDSNGRNTTNLLFWFLVFHQSPSFLFPMPQDFNTYYT